MNEKIGTYEPYKMPRVAINGATYRKGEYRSTRTLSKNHFVVIPAFLPGSFDLEAAIEDLRKELDVDPKSSKNAAK